MRELEFRQNTIGDGEQYTGLKDKNGVKIFEGDIVRLIVAYNCEYEYKDPSTVYNHDTKNVNIPISYESGCFILNSDKIPDDLQMIWLWDNLEIIGNIHQNPELLNE